MICPECQETGRKSIVYVGSSASKTAYYYPFYDEKNVYHHHDGNTVTTLYTCSNGHEFQETTIRKCPGCDWPGRAVRKS
jgi:hypothetical protein